MLGITIDPAYITARERTEAELANRQQPQKEESMLLQNEHWHPFTDAFSAYLAEDFPALHDLEMREQHGDDWENRVMIAHVSCENTFDDKYEHEVESLEKADDLEMFEPGIGVDWIPF